MQEHSLQVFQMAVKRSLVLALTASSFWLFVFGKYIIHLFLNFFMHFFINYNICIIACTVMSTRHKCRENDYTK